MVNTGSALPADRALKDTSEFQFSAKSLKNKHSTVMSKGGILEGKLDIPDTFSHMPNEHLEGAFLSEWFQSLDYSTFSSETQKLLLQKYGNSPFFQV